MNNRLRFLMVAAKPKEMSELALDDELRRLRNKMSDNVEIGNAEVMVTWAARPLDLQTAVRENRPHVLHFAGHGSREGIWLEDDEGNGQLLSKESLSLILSSSPELCLVVLNACATAPQTEALRQSVEYVMATPAPVEDSVALNFTSHFYRGLATGEKIREAFCHAQESIASERYQLFVRDDVDENKPLLPQFIDEVTRFRAETLEGDLCEVAHTFNESTSGTVKREPGNKRSQVDVNLGTARLNVLRIGGTINNDVRIEPPKRTDQ